MRARRAHKTARETVHSALPLESFSSADTRL